MLKVSQKENSRAMLKHWHSRSEAFSTAGFRMLLVLIYLKLPILLKHQVNPLTAAWLFCKAEV